MTFFQMAAHSNIFVRLDMFSRIMYVLLQSAAISRATKLSSIADKRD